MNLTEGHHATLDCLLAEEPQLLPSTCAAAWAGAPKRSLKTSAATAGFGSK